MPIQIQNSKFFTQLLNGEDFTLNTSEFYGQLVGNVGDLIKTEQTVRVSWTSESDGVNSFDILGTNTINRQAGSFIQDEMNVGDLISFYDTTVPAVPVLIFTRTITSLSTTSMIVDGAALTPAVYLDAKIFGLTALEGARHSYGLIENGEPTNFVSKISAGSAQDYSAGGVTTASPSFVTMLPAPGVASWQDDGEVKVKYDSTLGITDDFAQIFVIEHTFRIVPWFLDGEFSNIDNNIPPPLYATGNNLKYVFQGTFSKNLTTSDQKIVLLENVNGYTGWFDQNPIGIASDYSLLSIAYEDVVSAQAVDELDAQKSTEVTIVIESATATFTASTPFVLLLSYLPPLAQYDNNTNTIKQNFLFESLYQVTGAGIVSETIITDLTATFDSATEITITFKVDYSVAQQLVIQDGDYLIAVAVKDPGITSASDNDQVLVLADANQYDYSTDVENLMFIDNFQFYPHDLDQIETPAFNNYKGWIEDGFLMTTTFKLNFDEPAFCNDLKVHLSAYNEISGERFDIQTQSFNVGGAVVTNGVQQIGIGGTRNYNLAIGSQFNLASIKKSVQSLEGSINVQEYDMKIGFKGNFESWIAQLDADPIFFDSLLENDGLNKNVSRYRSNGYEMKLIVEGVVEDAVGVETTYTFLSQDLDFNDYDETFPNPDDWTCEIETLDTDDNLLDGQILSNDFTKVRATFTPTTTPPTFIAEWAIIRLYPEGGNVQNIYELSSFRDSIANNPLVPLSGESFTKITISATDVIVECMIDPTLLIENTNYCITARLSDQNQPFDPALIANPILLVYGSQGVNAKLAAFVSGANQLESTDAAFNHGSNPFTMQCWIAQAGTAGKSVMGWSTGGPAWRIRTFTNTKYVIRIATNASNYIEMVDNRTPLIGPYKHCVLTYDGGSSVNSAKFYIDGAVNVDVFTMTGTFTGMFSGVGGSMKLGAAPGFSNFIGSFDSHAQWNRVLNATEVAELYNSGLGLDFSSLTAAQQVGLIAWHEMNEPTGTRTDETVNARDLTDISSVLSSIGRVLEPAELGEKVFQWVDQSGCGCHLEQPIEPDMMLFQGTHLEAQGATQHLGTADATFDISGSISISGWFKADSNVGIHDICGKWDEALNSRGYRVTMNGTAISFQVSNDGTAVVSVTSGTSIAVGVWYSYSVYHDQVNDLIAISVTQQGATTAETLVTAPHATGMFPSVSVDFEVAATEGGLRAFDGDIDNTYAYQHVFTQNEVQNLLIFGRSN